MFPTDRAYDTTQDECLARLWSKFLLPPTWKGLNSSYAPIMTISNGYSTLPTHLGSLFNLGCVYCNSKSKSFITAGIVHQASDALPRLPTESTEDTPMEEDVPMMLIACDTEPDTAYDRLSLHYRC